MHRSIAAALLSALVSGAALAQAADPIRTQAGIRYACTGVDADSREDPRWKQFAGKLVFAAGSGDYLSQVTVRVVDAAGKTVVEVADCGPWLLLDLPQGRYRIFAAVRDGQAWQHDASGALSVGGAGRSETVIRFPDISG